MSDNSMGDATSKKVALAKEVLANKQKLSFSELQALSEALKQEGEKELAKQIGALAEAAKQADIERAEAILSNEVSTPEEMLKLGKRLSVYKRFGYARRLLERALDESDPTTNPDIYPEVFQKCAVFTYKDPDLPAGWRLDRALSILQKEGCENLSTTVDPETLGIAGAIYKRKWEVNAQRQNLERSLLYYLKGYAQGAPTEEARADIIKYLRKAKEATDAAKESPGAAPKPAVVLNAEKDRGYTGINAAFILDLLAQLEEAEAKKDNILSETSNRRRDDARLIRDEITRSVPPLIYKPQKEWKDKDKPELSWLKNEWWFYATIGEAYFGLDDYLNAEEWLVTKPKAAGLLVPEWEYESTARQLTKLALLKEDPNISEEEFEKKPVGEALKKLLNGDDKKVRSAFRGKFGLALSGGGFRASLYHIGVLARLAELDVLRHVEVLSCVSGGSIVGAYYYLELRNLLQTNPDDAITTQNYIDIVKRVEENFLKGVQRNIRTRVLAEFSTNLKMILWPGYSRTRRVGELYERELYSRVNDGEGKYEGWRWLPNPIAKLFGLKREDRCLNDLYIHPFISPDDKDEDFRPKDHNWKRKNKVPILILNATSLNTGHVWQFTASYMGEPPDPANSKVDANHRLRRMYYKDAPENYKKFRLDKSKDYTKFRLGYAVAASSGVPGLFEPLILDSLYPDKSAGFTEEFSVRLVDGGVYDNQGIAGLLEQDCTVLLVSDASGQMDTESVPSSRALNVLWRSNNISMARVRGLQYNEAVDRKNSLLIRSLMFVHLKQELAGKDIAWKDCPDHLKVSEFGERDSSSRTSYGIAAEIQEQLAAIRTDLDSFSDAEAYALMASGYRMTARQFEGKDKCIDGFTEQAAGDWSFRKREVEDGLRGQGKRKKHLEKLLEASGSLAFKVWSQSLPLKILKWTLLFLAISLIGFGFYTLRYSTVVPVTIVEWIKTVTFGMIGLAILLTIVELIVELVLSAIFGKAPSKYIMLVIKWRDTRRKIGVGVVMCLLGWIIARLHLHVFDRMFLSHGKLENFPKEN